MTDFALIATVYGGVVLAALWLTMVFWTNRDMRARSRDPLAQIFVTAIVLVLNVPGLLIYLMLRPRETLAEAYERSLEEEAVLQEIEEKPTCPGCSQRVHANWQVCPHCHTKLKKGCYKCGQSLELAWNICPHCATPQAVTQVDDIIPARLLAEPRPQKAAVVAASDMAHPSGMAQPAGAMAEPRRRRREARAAQSSTSLEFVDGE
jgi:hypothetical protein